MKADLQGNILEIPDISPTPRAIIDEENNQVWVLATDNSYIPVPYLRKKSGVLTRADGKPVLEVKGD